MKHNSTLERLCEQIKEDLLISNKSIEEILIIDSCAPSTNPELIKIHLSICYKRLNSGLSISSDLSMDGGKSPHGVIDRLGLTIDSSWAQVEEPSKMIHINANVSLSLIPGTAIKYLLLGKPDSFFYSWCSRNK